MGVEKVVSTIEDVGDIVVAVAELVKHGGVGIGGFGKLVELVSDVKALVEDAVAALPELSDVDAAEAGQLATAAYTQFKRIVGAVAG